MAVPGADLRLVDAEPLAEGLALTLEIAGRRHRAELSLAGVFQAHNVLAALGLVLAGGVEPGAGGGRAWRAWKACAVGWSGWRAHRPAPPSTSTMPTSPERWRRCVAALRPHATGRLAVVFGCGGDRDRGKRPENGRDRRAAGRSGLGDRRQSAERGAGRDPGRRSWPAVPERGRSATGRRRSRRRSASSARGDVLVIAGKGHETGQIVGDEVRPFGRRRGGACRSRADGGARGWRERADDERAALDSDRCGGGDRRDVHRRLGGDRRFDRQPDDPAGRPVRRAERADLRRPRTMSPMRSPNGANGGGRAPGLAAG